jgi:hypothetical protein
MSRDKDQVGDNESFTSGIVFQVGLVDIKDRTRALRTGIIRDMCTILRTTNSTDQAERPPGSALNCDQETAKIRTTFYSLCFNQYCFWYERKKNYRSWIFSWDVSHICANDEYQSQEGRFVTGLSLRLRDISKVTAHERIQHL